MIFSTRSMKEKNSSQMTEEKILRIFGFLIDFYDFNINEGLIIKFKIMILRNINKIMLLLLSHSRSKKKMYILFNKIILDNVSTSFCKLCCHLAVRP